MSQVRNIWFNENLTNVKNVQTVTAATDVQDVISNRIGTVVSIGDALYKRLKEQNPSVDINEFLGAIEFRFATTSDGTTNSTNIAFKQNANISVYPVVGEKVFISQVDQIGFVYTPAVNINNNINNNITGGYDELENATASDPNTYASSRDNSGLVNVPPPTTENDFTPQNIVIPVKFKPGDLVMEGRYSNFMTFTSEDDGKSPIIMIGTNKATEPSNTLLTNDSTILISTNQKVVIPPFKRNVSIVDYTKKDFIGKQMILISDRIYLGSKTKEMSLMSNSHIHLSSFGITSVDANDVNIKSNTVKIDSNSVTIGNGDGLESAAKADTLIKVLNELIGILISTKYGVAGTQTTLPTTIPELQALQTKLEKIASDQVKIS